MVQHGTPQEFFEIAAYAGRAADADDDLARFARGEEGCHYADAWAAQFALDEATTALLIAVRGVDARAGLTDHEGIEVYPATLEEFYTDECRDAAPSLSEISGLITGVRHG